MSELLLKMALLAALTHGIRSLSRAAGPRLGGLLLGLPSTTAVALAGCGRASGIAAATEMAEASLLGLVAAVTLPLAFAQAMAQGHRLAWAILAAVLAYFAVAWSAALLPNVGPAGPLVMAAVAILAAIAYADRIPIPERRRTPESRRLAPSRTRCLVLRTAIPGICLASVTALRELAGIRSAGLFSTFPGMSLTVLIVTYLESSPTEAGRMARTLPSANLGMVAFIAGFRFSTPLVGLGWGTAIGYAMAAPILLAVGWRTQRHRPALLPRRARVIWLNGRPSPRPFLSTRTHWSFAAQHPGPSTTPRHRRLAPRRRLAPLVEPMG